MLLFICITSLGKKKFYTEIFIGVKISTGDILCSFYFVNIRT